MTARQEQARNFIFHFLDVLLVIFLLEQELGVFKMKLCIFLCFLHQIGINLEFFISGLRQSLDSGAVHRLGIGFRIHVILPGSNMIDKLIIEMDSFHDIFMKIVLRECKGNIIFGNEYNFFLF